MTVLPLAGWTLSGVCLRTAALPVFTLSMPNQPDARLELAASVVTLGWAGREQTLRWDEERPYGAAVLGPFVEMLGRTVTKALAQKSGALTLELSGGISLAAVPDMWEGWHFSCDGVTLHGDDGRLI